MSTPIELVPGTDFAGYRIVSLLGHGGMSVVYLAEHLGLERKVAIKVLAPALGHDARFRDRFVRESRMAASLDHPNVIPIYEAGEADGRLFIAMRYVDGTDLKELIREFGPLSPADTFSIVRQAAGALDAAHARGLVHRDVKPANVLIAAGAESNEGRHVYLSDFGLTKRTTSESGITGTGQFVGTLDYAAPEQFEGKTLDARTDVYSLGCVLFECLAGHPPFRKEFDAALMYAHLSDAPPKPSAERGDLPDAIDAVVARAMAKSPDDRFQSAGEVARAAGTALGFETGEHAGPFRPLRRRRSRRRAAIAAVALVVVGALLAVLLPTLLAGKTPPAEAATPPGMAIISAADGHQTAFIPLSRVQSPVEAIFAGGHFWVLNINPVSFVEIDPRSGRILRQIASPTSDVGYFTVDGNTLWVTNNGKPIVYSVNVSSVGSGVQFTIPHEQFGLGWPAVGFGSLWVGTQDGSLYRLDPSSGHVLKRLPGLGPTYGVVAGGGAVWTAGDRGMTRVDPRTYDVTHVDSARSTGGYLAVGGGFAWVTDEFKGVVSKVNDTGSLADTYATGEGARVVSYSDGTLWVGNQDGGTVTAIDAVTGSTRTYRFDHPLQAVAAGSGRVLVQMNEGRTYEDRIDALRGSVARLIVQGYQLDTPDPALVWNNLGFEVENATCAPLLGHPDAEGQGALRPEVAASMPEVSPDGRTYTFTVRPGFRFSPPSNQPVTAETYRFSIERALSPGLGDQTPGPFILPDIQGEDAFRAGKADHVSGLRASGNTLSITLTKPSPDILDRLSSTFFCPVPSDSTDVRGGAVRNLGGTAGRDMVPSAGPYYIADHLNGEYLILKRNPNYGGTRPHRFDAIALREGIDPGQAVARVEKGTWDGIVNLYDPILAPDGALADRFGSSGAGRGPTYAPTPDGWSFTLAINARSPLFSDPAVRRAVSYALDRPTVARTQGADAPGDGVLPSAQVVAPNLPGVPAGSPYPLDGPDLAKAKALMHGRSGTAALAYSTGCTYCAQSAEAIRSELAPIGITVQLKPVEDSFTAIHDHPNRYDLKVLGAAPDYPSTASYLITIFGDYIPTEWLPASIRSGLAKLEAAPAATREQEAAAFLAGPVTHEVPAAGIGYSVSAALLSPRLGCRVFRPFEAGPDLAALCPAGGAGASPGSPSA